MICCAARSRAGQVEVLQRQGVEKLGDTVAVCLVLPLDLTLEAAPFDCQTSASPLLQQHSEGAQSVSTDLGHKGHPVAQDSARAPCRDGQAFSARHRLEGGRSEEQSPWREESERSRQQCAAGRMTAAMTFPGQHEQPLLQNLL
jgi:hypothetical protein